MAVTRKLAHHFANTNNKQIIAISIYGVQSVITSVITRTLSSFTFRS